MAYTLELTTDDLDAIAFAGDRYEWSLSLATLAEGTNELSESEAWTISEAIESDMDGGHNAYPLLDPRSDLAEKLTELYQSIV